MSSISSQIQVPKILSAQFVFVLILVSGYSWIIIDSDITFFDTYVLEDISYCSPDRYEQEHCESLRESTGCMDSMDQNCIGNVYWQQVNKQAFGLAAILFIARMIPSVVNDVVANRKKFRLNKIAVLDASWWSSLAIIIFYFGIIDFGYYVFRGFSIPQELPWLNFVGVFVHTKQLGLDPLMVEGSDLLITVGLGILAMGAVLFVVSAIYRSMGKSNVKRIT